MINKKSKNVARQQRHAKIRKVIIGTNETPRLNVFKSNTNIYAQIIDDEKGITLVSASSLSEKLKGTSKEKATKVGELIAKKSKDAKISKVVFDRGGYLYHGVVQALADSARENGLKF